MLELVLYTIMFAVLGYGLLALSGVLGNAGILIAGLVLISALLAGLLVSYQNTRERLSRLEKKLDALLEAQEKPDAVQGKERSE